MSQSPKADIIIAVNPDRATVFNCVQRALEHGGEHLNRLIVFVEHCAHSDFHERLERLADLDARIEFVRKPLALDAIVAYNSELAKCEGDAVLLNGECAASPNWLSELHAVAHSEERTGSASPLMYGAGICSVPDLGRELDCDQSISINVRTACVDLPRWTVAPMLAPACIYLRRTAIDAVGLLDPSFKSSCDAVNDWVSRSKALGFVAKRANHAYVHHTLPRSDDRETPASLDQEPTQLGAGEAHREHQLGKYYKTLDCHLPSHAIRAYCTGKLRVAYDIRHLAVTKDGTRTYAVCLANALALLSEIDLTLIVNHDSQAEGLSGRVVTPEQWADDVAVIHKPAQVGEPNELALLFDSTAHLVITYQDLIAYRIALAFSSDDEFDRYRATSGLSLQGFQRLIAYSENTSNEITAEFGIPKDEITVTPLGVDVEWFSHRDPLDQAIKQGLTTPALSLQPRD